MTCSKIITLHGQQSRVITICKFGSGLQNECDNECQKKDVAGTESYVAINVIPKFFDNVV